MNDLDTLLREEGARWRESQPEPVVDWAVLESAPGGVRRTRSALLAVAAAVAAVLVGSLLWRPWSGSPADVAEPTLSPTASAPLPSAETSPGSPRRSSPRRPTPTRPRRRRAT
jgi:hypothetical protein